MRNARARGSGLVLNHGRITFMCARKARLVSIPELQAPHACPRSGCRTFDVGRVTAVLNHTLITRVQWPIGRSIVTGQV
jgi:hypothetical protein